MPPTEADLRALQVLKAERGRLSCTQVGERLWGRPARSPQSWARPAGKVLRRLVEVGWVARSWPRPEVGSVATYTILPEGTKVLRRASKATQPRREVIMRMDAYYFGFDSTGSEEIDGILSAVACAGKAYHHTEDWTNDAEGEGWGHNGGTPIEWIENAARAAAERANQLEGALKCLLAASEPMDRYLSSKQTRELLAAREFARSVVEPEKP